MIFTLTTVVLSVLTSLTLTGYNPVTYYSSDDNLGMSIGMFAMSTSQYIERTPTIMILAFSLPFGFILDYCLITWIHNVTRSYWNYGTMMQFYFGAVFVVHLVLTFATR